MGILVPPKGGKRERFAVIGGTPFRCYTGTVSYTGLKVVGTANTSKQVKVLVKKHYDACGGLMLVIDLATGKEAGETDEKGEVSE